MNKKFNYWIIIAILFFLFGTVLFFYSEDKNNSLIEDYNDCINNKAMCVSALNQSLIEWKNCMYNLGEFYNVTKEEIDMKLNEKEVKK